MPVANHIAAVAPQSSTHDIEQLRGGMTSVISLTLIAVGGLTTLFVAPDFSHKWGGRFQVCLSLLIEGMLAYYLHRKKPLVSQALLVLGPTLSLALALRLMSSPAVPYYAVLIVIANFAIRPAAGFIAAMVNTLSLLALRRVDGLLFSSLGVVWLTAGLEFISLRAFQTVLAWSESSQQRSTKLLAELRAHQGDLNRALASLTEATRRLQRANHELGIARQHAEEARDLKEQFVANVSHELRTPLNLVVGFAEMMYLDPDGYDGVVWTSELVGDIGELYRASRHLQSLVGDILDLSRIDASRLPMFRELQDIRPIVAQAVETIAPLVKQSGLACNTEWAEEVPCLFVDGTRIRQVMLNLLNNAVRFATSGGITIGAQVDEEAVIVSVHDTGVGIPEDQLGKLFERFRQGEAGTRSGGGAGLGLALSRQFVELHGGRMWAESQVGVGSTFYVSLPLPGALPQVVSLRQTRVRKQTDLSGAPLVLVDPDPGIAEMLSRYLGDRPLLPLSDTDDVEALVETERPLGVIINQSPDAPTQTWLGGVGDLCKRHSVPVVRCSIPSPSWLVRATGLDDCLTKPVSQESLSRMLDRYCREPSTILVVDDDPGFVKLVSRWLRTLPMAADVLTAYTGADALGIARNRTPDLMFLDLLMPEMDGFEVLETVRDDPMLEDMRVIAVTATSYAMEVLRRHGGQLTLTRAGGIPTGQLVDVLNAIFQCVRPSYGAEESATWRV